MAPWEVHPSVVHFPIALLQGGVALALYACWRRREPLARAATGLLVAALAGLLAFFPVPAHAELASP
jgi:uncharacterized membrane protein